VEDSREHVSAQYVYRSKVSSPQHRQQTSWYLVARLEGSNVVARIDALGLLPATRNVAAALGVVGPWRTTPSRHHVRALVALSNAS
jgi:hypothetical protein